MPAITRPSTVGVRRGAPWTRSKTRNHDATTAAPMRPATTPSLRIRPGSPMLTRPPAPSLARAGQRHRGGRLLAPFAARPPEEDDRAGDQVPDRPPEPHQDTGGLLVGRGGERPRRPGAQVERIEHAVGERDGRGGERHRNGAEEEIEELDEARGAGPLREGTHDRPPAEEGASEEREVLEGVDGRPVEGGPVEERDVPPHEGRRAEDEGGQGSGEPPPRSGDPGDAEHRAEEPPRRAEEPERRDDEDEQEVLEHVGGERDVLGQLGEGPEERPRHD